MSEVLGADADALDRVSVSVDQVVRHLDGPTRKLNGAIHSSPWSGRNADLFRRKWDSEYWHSIRLASEFLKEASTDLRRNAQQQRDASAVGGGAQAGSGQPDSASSFFDMLRAIKRFIERLHGDPIDKPLFDNGADPSDIRQGSTGDCWLMASLGSIASTPRGKEWIKKVITDNGDGTYTVHFKDGQNVVVDNVRDGGSCFSEADKWAFIIEKAFAKRHGGFGSDFMNGNFPSEAFKDLGLQNVQDRRGDYGDDYSDADLRMALSSGKAVTAWGTIESSSGIHGGKGYHAFSVIDSTSNSVTLRNPWGFNKALEADGVTFNSDGTFTVSLAQFRQLFNNLEWADVP